MKSGRILIGLAVALIGVSIAETTSAAEKAKVVARQAVRSRNYGAVQIRTADLTPETKFDFKTIQWGYGPGIYSRAYYPGYYGYPRWGYYNYYRPYPAYYAYRPYYYAGGPPNSYAYYDPAFSYYSGPSSYSGPAYGARAYAGDYGGCYHW